MATEVVEELAELIGARINALGLTLMKGIVFQIAPEYDPKMGTLLHGAARYPFVSVGHYQAEQPNMEVSTNVTTFWTRIFTVAIVADKSIVFPLPGPYTGYRSKAMRALHTYRGDGTLSSIPNACIMQATVRPSSPIQQSAWAQYAKFVSTFDVAFQTEEPTGLT